LSELTPPRIHVNSDSATLKEGPNQARSLTSKVERDCIRIDSFAIDLIIFTPDTGLAEAPSKASGIRPDIAGKADRTNKSRVDSAIHSVEGIVQARRQWE
jgi:hypothetical protein